jgi:hypothetical protein
MRKNIMKTFIYKNKKYQFKNMEEANNKLALGAGAWFGPEEGEPANTYRWEEGNFFD